MAESSRNYQNGKFYCIRNWVDDDIYVDSTCQALSKRMAWHRQSIRSEKKKHYKIYHKINELGIDNFYIELYENYPCGSKEELVRKEGEIIRTLNPLLNKRVEGRTRNEYYDDNKDKIKENCKQYRENNKDKVSEYQTQYREDNKDYLKEYDKQRNKNRKEYKQEYNKQYYNDNKYTLKENYKLYYESNKDKVKEKDRLYYKNNNEKYYKNKQFKLNVNAVVYLHIITKQDIAKQRNIKSIYNKKNIIV